MVRRMDRKEDGSEVVKDVIEQMYADIQKAERNEYSIMP
jgi:hypothetical protein